MSDEEFPTTHPKGNVSDEEFPAEEPPRKRKKKETGGFKKAPQAPKRFKSSYIFFSMDMMEKIKQEGGGTKVTSASARVAEEWKKLSPEDRKKWEDKAREDKLRYVTEKSLYTGPWQVPSKRSRKDPTAPKRPMSAFLFFSQGMRTKLKEQNPSMKNTEVSRVLGNMWKSASEEERRPHIEREARERAQYKKDIAEWRGKREEEMKAQRKMRDEIVSEAQKCGFVGGMQVPVVLMQPPLNPVGIPPIHPMGMVASVATPMSVTPDMMPPYVGGISGMPAAIPVLAPGSQHEKGESMETDGTLIQTAQCADIVQEQPQSHVEGNYFQSQIEYSPGQIYGVPQNVTFPELPNSPCPQDQQPHIEDQMGSEPGSSASTAI